MTWRPKFSIGSALAQIKQRVLTRLTGSELEVRLGTIYTPPSPGEIDLLQIKAERREGQWELLVDQPVNIPIHPTRHLPAVDWDLSKSHLYVGKLIGTDPNNPGKTIEIFRAISSDRPLTPAEFHQALRDRNMLYDAHDGLMQVQSTEMVNAYYAP